MPYEYNGRTIREGRGWVDSRGIKHPSNWAGAWSDAKKAEMGLTLIPVKPPYDNRFYWGWDSNDQLIERALEDVLATDENGDPILDEYGDQLVTKGLKTTAISKLKQQANNMLQSSDWMVIRGVENPGKPVSTDVDTYRTAVRTKVTNIEAAINACTTLADFIGLHETPVDQDGNPTGNAIINDFPVPPKVLRG